MKPAAAQSRNLRELDQAEELLKLDTRNGAASAEEQRALRRHVLIGALSQLVSPEVWDQALNTTYGYIASCQVKLRTYQLGNGIWHAFDEAVDISNDSILGAGRTEQAAKDDFWEQWKKKRDTL